MLDLTEAPAQRLGPSILTGSHCGCPLPSLRNMSSERSLSCNYLQFCKASCARVSCKARLPAFSQQWSSASVGVGGHWRALRAKPAAKSAAAVVVAVLAPMCADKFRQGAEASANMGPSLKKVSSWMQDSYIEKGGWATFPGMTSPERGVAQACATMLTASQ